MMIGVLWGGVISLALLFFFLVQLIWGDRPLPIGGVVAVALFTDIVIHAVVWIFVGPSALRIFWVSFPLVGAVCLLADLLVRAGWAGWMRRATHR